MKQEQTFEQAREELVAAIKENWIYKALVKAVEWIATAIGQPRG